MALLDPDWKDINDHDSSTIGYARGDGLSEKAGKALDSFIKDLGTGKVQLFKGPLNYQDGTTFIGSGRIASDKEIWYMKQLLQGMVGQSGAK